MAKKKASPNKSSSRQIIGKLVEVKDPGSRPKKRARKAKTKKKA